MEALAAVRGFAQRVRTGALACLIAATGGGACPTFAAPASRPAAAISADGHLDITLPPNILRNDEVHKHLTSGLTTVFLLTVNDATARVEIRYDLWDEKFLVTIVDSERRVQKTSIDSFEHLADWWSRTPLRTGPARTEARAKLEVIPFSASEEEDAQRWLARSIGESGNVADQGDTSSATRSAGGILDLLIGTSVQRHPLQTWRWTLHAERPK